MTFSHSVLSQSAQAERNLSLTVQCPHCHAPTGEVCFRKDTTGKRIPLQRVAAHPQRTTTAEAAQEHPTSTSPLEGQ